MLPIPQRIAFLLFAAITGAIGLYGFYRLYLRIRRGRADTDARLTTLAAPHRLRAAHHPYPEPHLPQAFRGSASSIPSSSMASPSISSSTY